MFSTAVTRIITNTQICWENYFLSCIQVPTSRHDLFSKKYYFPGIAYCAIVVMTVATGEGIRVRYATDPLNHWPLLVLYIDVYRALYIHRQKHLFETYITFSKGSTGWATTTYSEPLLPAQSLTLLHAQQALPSSSCCSCC